MKIQILLQIDHQGTNTTNEKTEQQGKSRIIGKHRHRYLLQTNLVGRNAHIYYIQTVITQHLRALQGDSHAYIVTLVSYSRVLGRVYLVSFAATSQTNGCGGV